MTIPVGAGIVSDATASGGQAVKMTRSSTSLTGQVSLPASVTFLSLIARDTTGRGSSLDDYEDRRQDGHPSYDRILLQLAYKLFQYPDVARNPCSYLYRSQH